MTGKVIHAARKPLRMGPRHVGDPFGVLGDLRKGMPKGAKGVGRELQDFRLCNFNEQDPRVMEFIQATARQVVPPEGTPYYVVNHLPFLFPSATVAGNLNITNDCYKGGILVHRCSPETKVILTERDIHTYKPTIKNGVEVATGNVKLCDDKPIYTYENKDGDIVEVGCSCVVRMRVMLRGQRTAGYWDVLSGSAIDGTHLRDRLETLFELFVNSGIPELRNGLWGVPFILHRQPPVEVPYFDANDKRKTSKHSFIDVEVAPHFGSLLMEAMTRVNTNALQVLQLSPGNGNALKAGEVEDTEAAEDLLDQAEGGVRFNTAEDDPFITAPPLDNAPAPAIAAPAPEPDEKQAEEINWQTAYEGLQLPRSKAKAALEYCQGDYHKAYDFIMSQRAAAAGKPEPKAKK